MEKISIGPFELTFTPAGVQFHPSQQTDEYTLTNTECYKLLEVLYQRRQELYQRMQSDEQPGEGPASMYLAEQHITYTVNNESLAITSWEEERGKSTL